MKSQDPYKDMKDHADEVAETMYQADAPQNASQLSQGLSETHEQISDNYMSGNNDETFIRDGKDLAE